MRVATFNILHGRNPADDVSTWSTFASAIAGLDADVLALQEVDRNQPRSHGADLTAVAAEAMGAREHRFVAAMSGSPGATWVAATGEEQPDAATYGVALLSRHPVSAWNVVKLPRARAPTPFWFRGERLPTLVRDEAAGGRRRRRSSAPEGHGDRGGHPPVVRAVVERPAAALPGPVAGAAPSGRWC